VIEGFPFVSFQQDATRRFPFPCALGYMPGYERFAFGAIGLLFIGCGPRLRDISSTDDVEQPSSVSIAVVAGNDTRPSPNAPSRMTTR
jgi:hypothetical protein